MLYNFMNFITFNLWGRLAQLVTRPTERWFEK